MSEYLFTSESVTEGHPDKIWERPVSLISRLAAGFGTLQTQVAGLHRASPSTTLYKAYYSVVNSFYTIPRKKSIRVA